jgi:hypothetical protein
MGMNRRKFLLTGTAAGVVVLGGLGFAFRRARRIELNHRSVPGFAGHLDEALVETLVSLLAAWFGVRIAGVDRRDLQGRLDFAVNEDGGWLEEYVWLSQFLDRQAREANVESFKAASAAIQVRIIRLVTASDPVPGVRFRRLLSTDYRGLVRARRSTLRHLREVYLHSGVPWRRRGYDSWPGIPGDLYAYTKPHTGIC